GLDHIGQVDLLRGPRQHVATVRPPDALDQPRLAQVGHDLLQEALRDLRPPRDHPHLDRLARGTADGEVEHGIDRVFALGREDHLAVIVVAMALRTSAGTRLFPPRPGCAPGTFAPPPGARPESPSPPPPRSPGRPAGWPGSARSRSRPRLRGLPGPHVPGTRR